MNIQYNNVNFGARRVLNVRKAVKNGADEVIDVFALGKEDKKFIALCSSVLKENARVAVEPNFANINHLGGNADKGYRDFFRDFLTRLSNKKPIFVQDFDDVHCYIAIKNGETISGVAEISDANFPFANIDRMIFTKKDESIEDGFLYGILTDLKNVFKKEGQDGLNGLKKRISNKVNKDGYLRLGDFGHAQRTIARKNNDIKIDRVKDPYKYDLEDFLGIKDIETEIIG